MNINVQKKYDSCKDSQKQKYEYFFLVWNVHDSHNDRIWKLQILQRLKKVNRITRAFYSKYIDPNDIKIDIWRRNWNLDTLS